MNTSIAYLGIDAGKSFHVACVKNSAKRSFIPSLTFTDDQKGYDQLRHCLDSLKDKHGITLFAAGIESTGTYHVKVVEYLRTYSDIHLTVLNPLQTSHYLKSDLRRAATDKVSAEVIALFMAEKTPAPTTFLPEEYETIKHLVHHLHSLSKQKTASINRLREHLALVWPEFERTYHDYNTKQILALLTLVQTPDKIAAFDFVAHKKITSSGSVYTLRADFIEAVKDLAAHSQRRFSRSATEPIIKSLAEEILFLLHQIDQITESMREIFARHSVTGHPPLLATIQGVGEEAAMVVTAHIGDPQRFSSVKQVVACFGMNPGVKESGTSIHGKRHLQKKGNALVRYYLFNCVLTMIRYPEHPIAKFYHRLCEQGKPKMVAMIACMKKLLIIMFTMLRSNTPFSMSYAS